MQTILLPSVILYERKIVITAHRASNIQRIIGRIFKPKFKTSTCLHWIKPAVIHVNVHVYNTINKWTRKTDQNNAHLWTILYNLSPVLERWKFQYHASYVWKPCSCYCPHIACDIAQNDILYMQPPDFPNLMKFVWMQSSWISTLIIISVKGADIVGEF